MSKEHKDPLAKEDDGKRDFLKKMAIGTAYAVPVMTTFSLDGVRNTALAQGNYGPARVTDMQGGQNEVIITFSRAMDTGFQGSAAVPSIPCWWDSFMGKSTSGSWTWDSKTQRAWRDNDCYARPMTVTVLINQPGCGGNPVLDANGNECVPYSGTATIFGCDD